MENFRKHVIGLFAVSLTLGSCSQEEPSDEQKMRDFDFGTHESKIIDINVVDQNGQPAIAPVVLADEGKIIAYGVSDANGRFAQEISWNAGMDVTAYAGDSEPTSLGLVSGTTQLMVSRNNHMSYKGMEATDTDGDGVVDSLDVDPNDANISAYASADGRFLFEDNFPYTGDYDFNDVVVDYQVMGYLDNMGDVRKAVFIITPRNSGAGNPNSLHMRLGELTNSDLSNLNDSSGYGTTITKSPNAVEWELSEEFNSLNGLGVIDTTSSTFTWEQTVRIQSFLYERQGYHYYYWVDMVVYGTSSYTNYSYQQWETEPTNRFRSYKIMALSFDLPSGYTMADISGDNLDIFIKNQAGKEVHSKAVNPNCQDDDGMPYAINVPNTVKWPKENVAITDKYSKFTSWATSNGTMNQNWWE